MGSHVTSVPTGRSAVNLAAQWLARRFDSPMGTRACCRPSGAYPVLLHRRLNVFLDLSRMVVDGRSACPREVGMGCVNNSLIELLDKVSTSC